MISTQKRIRVFFSFFSLSSFLSKFFSKIFLEVFFGLRVVKHYHLKRPCFVWSDGHKSHYQPFTHFQKVSVSSFFRIVLFHSQGRGRKAFVQKDFSLGISKEIQIFFVQKERRMNRSIFPRNLAKENFSQKKISTNFFFRTFQIKSFLGEIFIPKFFTIGTVGQFETVTFPRFHPQTTFWPLFNKSVLASSQHEAKRNFSK